MAVTNRTRAQSTIEALREMILSGELAPGSRLQAQMLADRLGVSRTPIVDALAVLHKEGLLDYAPNRGYGVKNFGLSDLLDAFDVRLTLEGLACRLVAERGLSADETVAIEHNLSATEALLFGESWMRADQDRWPDLNLAFHDIIIGAAGNAYLSSGVAATRSLPMIHMPSMGTLRNRELHLIYRREQMQQAFRDHARIFEAIGAGQSGRAEHMMREHIFTNREALRRNLEGLAGVVPDVRADVST